MGRWFLTVIPQPLGAGGKHVPFFSTVKPFASDEGGSGDDLGGGGSEGFVGDSQSVAF